MVERSAKAPPIGGYLNVGLSTDEWTGEQFQDRRHCPRSGCEHCNGGSRAQPSRRRAAAETRSRAQSGAAAQLSAFAESRSCARLEASGIRLPAADWTEYLREDAE